jgi:hypothetical protein
MKRIHQRFSPQQTRRKPSDNNLGLCVRANKSILRRERKPAKKKRFADHHRFIKRNQHFIPSPNAFFH